MAPIIANINIKFYDESQSTNPVGSLIKACMKTLRLILGDQLTHSLPILEDLGAEDHVLMMEVYDEAAYVPHHPKKIAFLFSAMRHFSKELTDRGIKVHYIRLDSEESRSSFSETLEGFLEKESFNQVLVTEPGEWRVLEEFQKLEDSLEIPLKILPDTRFFCSIPDFKKWAKGKKSLLMENFYRLQRKEQGILLEENGKPAGGEWNYDKENRKAIKGAIKLPRPMHFKHDQITEEVLDLVRDRFSQNFGSLDHFWFAVTHTQAKRALSHFIEYALPQFGDFQDAMKKGEYYLFHSALSQYLNCGLLTPREICHAVEEAYSDGKVPINSAEGYIRQVLGWREFIRGIYWTFMPKYKSLNALGAKRPLPNLYWGGETKMQCMQHVVKQTEEEAHSHHIQRLMITGNFALIAGLDPAEVCEWYLAVYADAYEWVELPNTLGMALFADGGIVGTKPYAASGAYINRMSNFCKTCEYNVKDKTGEKACPFNYLYWDFLMRHESKFRQNNRMKMILTHLDRMTGEDKKTIQKQASAFLRSLY